MHDQRIAARGACAEADELVEERRVRAAFAVELRWNALALALAFAFTFALAFTFTFTFTLAFAFAFTLALAFALTGFGRDVVFEWFERALAAERDDEQRNGRRRRAHRVGVETVTKESHAPRCAARVPPACGVRTRWRARAIVY